MTKKINAGIPENALPPQNIDAEESILGGILLDPGAIGRVVDLLVPEAFYVLAHQQIYQGALKLHLQGQPTDLMTVTSWLSDCGLLEKVGGTARLAQLVDRTVSAVNIDRYAALIMDKYLRRQLITAGHEIVDLGYDTAKNLETVLDESEQKIFRLTQERPQDGLIPLGESLAKAYNEIEKLHQQVALPGITTNFYDLDAMTGGFQRSDLIILAGRPSMGKTALALGMGANIARLHQQPVAIFSLEMSREQLGLRLLAAESAIPSNRLRSGRLSQTDFDPLAEAMGTLMELPIYIDDTANLTIMQIRSQVRRLQAQQKGKLGLVLIDYLQLMEGGGGIDNRVQELSKITRSMKGLARELNVPIIALSQLSRNVEQRNNKRPMMSDLRESGCLSGDSLVLLGDSNREVPIRKLVGKSGFAVWGMNPKTMKLERAIATNVFATGVKPIFNLTTSLKRTIKATANHQFFTPDGWKRLDELARGDSLAVSSKAFGSTPLTERDPIAPREINWDEIIAIEPNGITEVYDLTVPATKNFLANNLIVHNSIEQDADLVIMLYRDSYYNPDSPDRNIAEVIITKHRNGPTGTVKLLFQPELTKFENLANPDNY